MASKLLNRILDIEEQESGTVYLLLVMSFFMGTFLASFSVASQTLFLTDYPNDLPLALLISGLIGFGATVVYNILQSKIPFQTLGIITLLGVTGAAGFIEFGELFFEDHKTVNFYGFTLLAPFTFLILLIFWGTFNRLFNVRQSKRLLGSVDQGAMIASVTAFFLIPIALTFIKVETLFTVALVSVIIFTVLFIVLANKYLVKAWTFKQEKLAIKKVSLVQFIKTPYIIYLSLFIILSMIALNFVDYSFLKVTTQQYSGDDAKYLPSFLSYFEMTVVIFSFLFQTFGADRLISTYGIKTSIQVNPLLLGIFVASAVALGLGFGYTPDKDSFLIFFVMIAMCKLFAVSIKESLDEPLFKLYLLPIDKNFKIDVQTKLEGVVTALASAMAGGLILLITRVEIFTLIYVTIFLVPILIGWFLISGRMYGSYRHTLQDTLVKSKQKAEVKVEREYTINSMLQREVNSTAEQKVVYGLKLMEKLEPALFESSLIQLSTSAESSELRNFANSKLQELGVDKDGKSTEIKDLARQAQGETEDSDLLSISVDKLMKLTKSIKQSDRILGAKLLRKLTSQRTIFILLELLRDADPKVRYEALLTARRVKRPETWPVLIELLSSPLYGHHAAAALKECGESVLDVLEAAFHKSAQSDLVMLRIVQIMGAIGGDKALDLLWKKADFPDKRIVKQILYSLRYINYKATGRQAREVTDLLEFEVSKTLWNLAALDEIENEDEHFNQLRQALREEIGENYEQISILLSILYDPQAVQLVKENIESRDPDAIAYALELMDLFVDPDLKPKLFPLFDDIPTKDKLELLQTFYPRESYNPIQVINYILNRDFNSSNRWTKVAATYTAAYIRDFRISRGLISQMFNSDKLLQETASWVIYNKNKDQYRAIIDRLPLKDKKFLDNSIANNQLLDGLDDGFFLYIEIVQFLKQLPEFRNIRGSLIADLADKVVPLDLFTGDKIVIKSDEENKPIFIVAHGEARLKENDTVRLVMKKGTVYGDLFTNEPELFNVDSLEATERTVVFRINLMDFYFVMANHPELVEGIIKNVTETETVSTK
ncbi:MAG: hypothetical protein L0Y35_05560 [Flammeovirgaceae bacterium]|nr:hypothetical protein [Flammeovirgaceae bacterium]